MTRKLKESSRVNYKRGKTEISGNSRAAKRLMFIDLISSKLFWIAMFIASIYIERKTGLLSTFFDLLTALLSGGKNHQG